LLPIEELITQEIKIVQKLLKGVKINLGKNQIELIETLNYLNVFD
jgi:hypothetical protein